MGQVTPAVQGQKWIRSVLDRESRVHLVARSKGSWTCHLVPPRNVECAGAVYGGVKRGACGSDRTNFCFLFLSVSSLSPDLAMTPKFSKEHTPRAA